MMTPLKQILHESSPADDFKSKLIRQLSVDYKVFNDAAAHGIDSKIKFANGEIAHYISDLLKLIKSNKL